MARINVLPKNIAELIAAGEVVERPASVIKELVENSIDASSSMITVEIKNGGITYMRVTDNGCGIFHDDVPKAFVSHATSKVATAEDLNSIFTLGFRGEALASVAAVSKTEILTKTADEEYGTTYAVQGGIQTRYDFAGCPDGTTIVVRDLFYNTPARMKFLKKDVSEANAVADLVDKLALSHPEISFRLIRDGKQVLLTPGDNKLLSAVHSVFGKNFSQTLIETNYELDGIKVSGLLSKPINSRASRAMQFFFLNGRYIKSKACVASLENAYKNSIMVGKFPACVLNITVPLYAVDVNVHPTKTEVRFSDERKVYSAVYYAVKSAIEVSDTRPKFDLSKVAQKAAVSAVQLKMEEKGFEAKPESKAWENYLPKKENNFWNNYSAKTYKDNYQLSSTDNDSPYIKAESEIDLITENDTFKVSSSSFVKTNNNEASQSRVNLPTDGNALDMLEDNDLPNLVVTTDDDIQKEKNPIITISEEACEKPFKFIGEAFKTYILCEYDGKLCLIDKHAAHERIIYNKIKSNKNSEKSQMLLSSCTLTLPKNEYNAVLENLDVFEQSGFIIDDFGKGSVIIRECPMHCDPLDAQDIVTEIASNLVMGKVDSSSDKIDMMMHTAACKAAIKAGNNNSALELEKLAKQVIFEDDIRYCPHGRPVLVELSRYDIEKQFKRIL